MAGGADAGIVHDPVEIRAGAELLQQSIDGVAIGQIGRHRFEPRRILDIVPVDGRHGVAGGRQVTCQFAAETRRGSGDERPHDARLQTSCRSRAPTPIVAEGRRVSISRSISAAMPSVEKKRRRKRPGS